MAENRRRDEACDGLFLGSVQGTRSVAEARDPSLGSGLNHHELAESPYQEALEAGLLSVAASFVPSIEIPARRIDPMDQPEEIFDGDVLTTGQDRLGIRDVVLLDSWSAAPAHPATVSIERPSHKVAGGESA